MSDRLASYAEDLGLTVDDLTAKVLASPESRPPGDVHLCILLSSLRQEALLQQLVDLSTGATPKPSRSRRKAG